MSCGKSRGKQWRLNKPGGEETEKGEGGGSATKKKGASRIQYRKKKKKSQPRDMQASGNKIKSLKVLEREGTQINIWGGDQGKGQQ